MREEVVNVHVQQRVEDLLEHAIRLDLLQPVRLVHVVQERAVLRVLHEKEEQVLNDREPVERAYVGVPHLHEDGDFAHGVSEPLLALRREIDHFDRAVAIGLEMVRKMDAREAAACEFVEDLESIDGHSGDRLDVQFSRFFTHTKLELFKRAFYI